MYYNAEDLFQQNHRHVSHHVHNAPTGCLLKLLFALHAIQPYQIGNGDIVLSQLNPTERYKSSVLAGLKPEVILDISGRAIAFYEYQLSQELCFKSILQSNIEQKYNTLKEQFNMMNRDLNHIIKASLREKELEKKKCQQIALQLEEKTKQFQKLQSMYEKLKRKAIVPNIQQQQQNYNPIPTASSVITSVSRMRAPSVAADQRASESLSKISQANLPTAFVPMRPPAIHVSNAVRGLPPSAGMDVGRIPSPIKSVYSVQSNRPLLSINRMVTYPATVVKEEDSGVSRQHHRHKHRRHRVKKM
ncbi:hypothetical protein G6F57_004241 [Rhizopus arrhizus]|nr:hypothetical protein G6F24_004012 [Rhizopus arrhizus]KAG1428642.1 hypothetical protein G6F58_000472 [Rhizopus delemar]KAG0793235.1 hypothetical protein G6F21_003773 [Rhizopus arrhizus]KAG0814314.1 hypothetical protein G6F20_004877 [Rhizopus arrhizus]KAG0834023.1 hypothetical protein G6F19_005425 [Rhizopus arrhizus]